MQPLFHPQSSAKPHSCDSCRTPSWGPRIAQCEEKPVIGTACLTVSSQGAGVGGQHLEEPPPGEGVLTQGHASLQCKSRRIWVGLAAERTQGVRAEGGGGLGQESFQGVGNFWCDPSAGYSGECRCKNSLRLH